MPAGLLTEMGAEQKQSLPESKLMVKCRSVLSACGAAAQLSSLPASSLTAAPQL